MRHMLAALKHDAEQSRIMDSKMPAERKVASEKVPESIHIPSNFNDAILRGLAESKNASSTRHTSDGKMTSEAFASGCALGNKNISHNPTLEKKLLESGRNRNAEALAADAIQMVHESKTASQQVRELRAFVEDQRDPESLDERRARLNESTLGRSQVEDAAPLPFPTTDPNERYDKWLARNNTHLAITAAAERRAEQAKRVSEQVAEIRASLNPNMPVKSPAKNPKTKPTPGQHSLESPHPEQKMVQSSAGKSHPQKVPAQYPVEKPQPVNEKKNSTSSTKVARRPNRRVEEAQKISARVAEIRASLNSMGNKSSKPTAPLAASNPDSGTWECPQCTISNAEWNTVCEACLFGKPNHGETTNLLKAPPIGSVSHQKAPPIDTVFQQTLLPAKQDVHYKKQQAEEVFKHNLSQVRHNGSHAKPSIRHKERTHFKPSIRGIDPTPSVTFSQQMAQPWDSPIQTSEPPLMNQNEIEPIVQATSELSLQRKQPERRIQPRDPSERRTRTIPLRDLSPPKLKQIERSIPKQDQKPSVIRSEKFVSEERAIRETNRSIFVDPPSTDEREGDVDPPSTGFDPPAHCDGGNAYQEDECLYQEEDAQYQEDEYQIQENASQQIFKRLQNDIQFVASDNGGMQLGRIDNGLSGSLDRSVVPSGAQTYNSNRRRPDDEKRNFLMGGLVSILDAYGVDRMCGVDDETLQMALKEKEYMRMHGYS